MIEFLLLDLTTGVRFPVSHSNVRGLILCTAQDQTLIFGIEPWSVDPKARILPLDQLVKLLFQGTLRYILMMHSGVINRLKVTDYENHVEF